MELMDFSDVDLFITGVSGEKVHIDYKTLRKDYREFFGVDRQWFDDIRGKKGPHNKLYDYVPLSSFRRYCEQHPNPSPEALAVKDSCLISEVVKSVCRQNTYKMVTLQTSQNNNIFVNQALV
jgi:hypothetical protein